MDHMKKQADTFHKRKSRLWPLGEVTWAAAWRSLMTAFYVGLRSGVAGVVDLESLKHYIAIYVKAGSYLTVVGFYPGTSSEPSLKCECNLTDEYLKLVAQKIAFKFSQADVYVVLRNGDSGFVDKHGKFTPDVPQGDFLKDTKGNDVVETPYNRHDKVQCPIPSCWKLLPLPVKQDELSKA